MMVVWNLPHGPYNDDVRFSQISEAWDECRRHFNPKTSVLFQGHAVDMLEDMSGMPGFSADTEGDADAALWAAMVEDPPLRKKGYKCNLNRFFGGTQVAREDLHKWTMRLFQYEYAALECGMLSLGDWRSK